MNREGSRRLVSMTGQDFRANDLGLSDVLFPVPNERLLCGYGLPDAASIVLACRRPGD